VKLKTAFRLTLLGLAGYGGYTLWRKYGAGLGSRAGDGHDALPSGRMIRERSELTVEEWAVGSDDPVAQATAILTESEERARLPRTAEGVERRRSEDTVEP